MDNLNVTRERHFSAHHMLLGAAKMALEDAKAKRPGWFYNHLIVITFSALSIEAIANAFGKRYIEKWKDFESSSPIAKIRILCNHFSVEMNSEKEPWSTAIWLMGLRNKIAHAKPELLEENHIWSREEHDKRQMEEPKAKIEKQMTLGNARRAYRAATKIKDLFCNSIHIEDQPGLRNDCWFGSASLAEHD